ncbi:Exopolygalacturonase [Sesamum alatum]|uniref:non-specific serine/threonine protein kinase n=1 Tax=Sesamum alatum TaxID=300844 RepID=A0AAE1YV06_9LAMI|nr:Exopolygalacturonase [Sesamum alatum]
MDSKRVFSLCASLVWFLSIISCVHGQNKIFTVTDFGAIPDGKTDSSKAFLDAWKGACAAEGGVLAVPLGTFFVNGATFEGPCNGETLFRTKGTLRASSDPSLDQEYWILFDNVDRLTILGNGTFYGNGESAWPRNQCDKSLSCKKPPTSIKFHDVRNSVVRGINSVNSKMFHLNLHKCDNVLVKNVDIIAPVDSPNTDGIHIGKSNNIVITSSRISTGDDCISMGDGSTNINITSVWCGPGHGISIGSLGKYKNEEDVVGITVSNCTFSDTDNGLRVKTWAPSSMPITVSNVTFADIFVNNVENPIIIDQYYCPNSSCSRQGESEVGIKGVKFIDVKGTSATEVAVNVQCSKSRPCQDIEFVGLDLTMKGTGQPTKASCSNADHEFLGPDNKLTGNVPSELTSLLKLEVLALANNNLSGTIPSFIGNFTSLRVLFLRNCAFQGQIPESLIHLQNLRLLVLGVNMLTGKIPSGLYNISTIRIFALTSNHLQGNIPSHIGFSLPDLKFFGLADNNFTGFLPVSLSNASSLQVISLTNNRFTGPMPKNLGSLPDLSGVAIGLANIQDDISFISSLTNCTKLKGLEISSNFLTGSLPHTIVNLSTHLSILAMGGNLIHGTIPSGIGDLTGLSVLVLASNLFSGPIPSSIGRLAKLEDLRANKFTDELPSSFGNLTLLSILSLDSNNISGSIPPSLGSCSHLLTLDLSDNNLSGPIPREIVSLSSISIYLDLSNNNLSGSIPSEVGSLRNLGALDLSNNRLSGIVPSTISSCISLQELNLAGNSFHGEIPQGLSPLKGLQKLDLSRNNFSGEIPSFLGELSLAYLDLSFNKLRGPVPVEGVFRNVSAVFLEENTELCGGISELKLPPCPAKNPKKKNSHAPLKIILPVSVSGVILIIAIITFSCIFMQRKTKSREDLYAAPSDSRFPRLSYADLHRATDGFSEANMMGSGEIWIRLQRNHQQWEHNDSGNDFTALIYQFKANGSLDKWLHNDTEGQDENSRYLTLMQRLNIVIDVASALEYLHNGTGSTVVHGDLKPSNILLDDDMTAHVGDFGLAKVISNVSSSLTADESQSVAIKGTIGYIAPGLAFKPFLLLLCI